MKYITTLVLILLASVSHNINAQQQGQYTQYMYTPSLLNPAYVGVVEVMNINFLHRSQWVGIKGAPTSQALVFTTPLNSKLGLGLSIINDKIGPATETNFAADISYILQLNEKGLNLSFGMKGGFQYLNVDFNKLTIQNPNDPYLEGNINSRFSPNVGAGVYLYNNNWYLGLSSPSLLSTEHYKNSKVSKVSNASHYYFVGGKNFTVNDAIQVKPAFLVRGVTGAPISIDLSLNFLFHKKFTAGISYRNKASIGGMINLKVNHYLSMGYAYDYETTDLSYFSGGSHEIILRCSFNKLIKGVSQPTWLY